MNIIPVHRLLSVINAVVWEGSADISTLKCDTAALSDTYDTSYDSLMSNDVDSSCYTNGAFIIGPYDDDGDDEDEC